MLIWAHSWTYCTCVFLHFAIVKQTDRCIVNRHPKKTCQLSKVDCFFVWKWRQQLSNQKWKMKQHLKWRRRRQPSQSKNNQPEKKMSSMSKVDCCWMLSFLQIVCMGEMNAKNNVVFNKKPQKWTQQPTGWCGFAFKRKKATSHHFRQESCVCFGCLFQW